MRWMPNGRKGRIALGSVAGLLLVGAIVGSETFDDDNRLSSQGGSGSVAGDFVTAEEDHGGFTAAKDLGVSAGPVVGPQPPAMSGGVMRAESGEAGGGTAGTAASGSGMAVSPAPSLPPIDAGRVVKTASVELEVSKKGFDAAHDDVLTLVEEAGGFVQDSQVSPTRASLTLRIPAERFESTLTRLEKLGKVKDERVSGQDVSEEYVDLDARLRHWTAQEAVFIELLGKANSIAETVEVRRELSTIQQTIEQLQGRIRYLDDRTGFSSVSLEMFVPGVAAKPETNGPSLSEAWNDARDAAISVIGGTLIVLGALVPLAVIAGGFGFVIWLGLRRRREPAPTPAA